MLLHTAVYLCSRRLACWSCYCHSHVWGTLFEFDDHYACDALCSLSFSAPSISPLKAAPWPPWLHFAGLSLVRRTYWFGQARPGRLQLQAAGPRLLACSCLEQGCRRRLLLRRVNSPKQLGRSRLLSNGHQGKGGGKMQVKPLKKVLLLLPPLSFTASLALALAAPSKPPKAAVSSSYCQTPPTKLPLQQQRIHEEATTLLESPSSRFLFGFPHHPQIPTQSSGEGKNKISNLRPSLVDLGGVRASKGQTDSRLRCE